EDDDVPRPQVVAVVAEPVGAGRTFGRGRRRPGAGAGPVEVGEVVRRLRAALVLVVAGRGTGPGLDAGLAPGRAVTVPIGGGVAARARPAQVVGAVAQHGHGGVGIVVQQRGGSRRSSGR